MIPLLSASNLSRRKALKADPRKFACGLAASAVSAALRLWPAFYFRGLWLPFTGTAARTAVALPGSALISSEPPSFTRDHARLQDALRGYKEIHLRASYTQRPDHPVILGLPE